MTLDQVISLLVEAETAAVVAEEAAEDPAGLVEVAGLVAEVEEVEVEELQLAEMAGPEVTESFRLSQYSK